MCEQDGPVIPLHSGACLVLPPSACGAGFHILGLLDIACHVGGSNPMTPTNCLLASAAAMRNGVRMSYQLLHQLGSYNWVAPANHGQTVSQTCPICWCTCSPSASQPNASEHHGQRTETLHISVIQRCLQDGWPWRMRSGGASSMHTARPE